MSLLTCNKISCTFSAVLASIALGVLTALLQITGTITVPVPFLWGLLGYAVVYLAALVLTGSREVTPALLLGLLGTTLTALALLAFGITATSVLSAIAVGLLLLFFTLTLGASACILLARKEN